MKKFPLALLFLFLPLLLVCQNTGAQDYVLTTRGDSLTGEVKPLLYGLEKKVQIIGPDKDKTSLSLFEVRAFSYEGDIYHPVKGESGYVFMKLLLDGYLSLYAYQQENQTRFDGLFLQKVDGANMVVPNLGFKKYMSQFLEDCPDIAERIKEGELNKKNLSELVEAYNACIASRTVDHKQIIVERRQQSTRLNTWDSLEEKVKAASFSEKSNALEIIAEIRRKVEQREKIPNFLVQALKNSLQDTGLTAAFEEALAETIEDGSSNR